MKQKYAAFKKAYKKEKNAEAQNLLLKNFMLSLSPDELIEWLMEGNKIMSDYLDALVDSKDLNNLQLASNEIESLEAMLKNSNSTVSKAA
jgi:hypothetical protein